MKKLYIFVQISLLLCVQSLVAPTEDFTRDIYLNPERNFRMLWNLNGTHITIELQVNTTGWIGIGISPSGSMRNADIFVGWVKNGEAVITDRHGQDFNGYPPLDEEQNVELLEGRECDGVTIIKFTRQLAACEAEFDKPITDDTIRLIYAFGIRDPLGDDLWYGDQHTFHKRGSRSILLLQRPHYPISGEELLNFDLLMDGTPIPTRSTYYECRLLQLPLLNETHHIVKIEPVVEEAFVKNVHHMGVLLCVDAYVNISNLGRSTECYTNSLSDFLACNTLIAGWAVGGGAVIFPDDVGLPIGEPGANRFVKLEIHYDNPLGIDINDASGMRFYYTRNLRTHDAGMFDVGHITSPFHLIIPPNTESFKIYGGCDSTCLGGSMEVAGVDAIHIFNIYLHSHLAGRAISLRHIRNGTELPVIAKDDSYDFDFQEPRNLSPPKVVRKGDDLLTVCEYSTMGENNVTVGGLDTSREMCIAFFFYYPRIPLSICNSAANTAVDQLNKMVGVTGVRRINENRGNIRSGLSDLIVTSPKEMENQTLYDVVNAYSWTKESSDLLSDEFATSTRAQICIGPQPQIPYYTVRAPINITHPLQSEDSLMCMAPLRGFSTSQQAPACNEIV